MSGREPSPADPDPSVPGIIHVQNARKHQSHSFFIPDLHGNTSASVQAYFRGRQYTYHTEPCPDSVAWRTAHPDVKLTQMIPPHVPTEGMVIIEQERLLAIQDASIAHDDATDFFAEAADTPVSLPHLSGGASTIAASPLDLHRHIESAKTDSPSQSLSNDGNASLSSASVTGADVQDDSFVSSSHFHSEQSIAYHAA